VVAIEYKGTHVITPTWKSNSADRLPWAVPLVWPSPFGAGVRFYFSWGLEAFLTLRSGFVPFREPFVRQTGVVFAGLVYWDLAEARGVWSSFRIRYFQDLQVKRGES